MRKVLDQKQIDPMAAKAIEGFYPEYISELEAAIQKNEWVIVGMRTNPVVSKARKHLDGLGIKYHYIEHGSYLSKWKERLAIKLWSGWPTFPQIFHKGVLIGGYADLKVYRS